MEDSSTNRGNVGDSSVIELAGKIIVVATILLFFVVAFVFCLQLFAKAFWYRNQETTATANRRRSRLDFASGQQEIRLASSLHHGLDPSILKTIPTLVYDPEKFKDGLECAVCLCDVSEGEKTRLLPKCNHGFHLDCIDMWFESHSTCPLCRNPVANTTQSNESTLENVLEAPMGENIEPPTLPTNVLFWGDETQVSSLSSCLEEGNQESAIGESSSSSSCMGTTINRPDKTLVIDVPTRINEDEEQKSPLPTRLRSLKRLLSGSRRVNPSSPRNLDLEEGGRGES